MMKAAAPMLQGAHAALSLLDGLPLEETVGARYVCMRMRKLLLNRTMP